MLVQYGQVEKKKILIIEDGKNPTHIQKSKLCTYIHLSGEENSTIQLLIRERKIDAILSTQSDLSNSLIADIIKLARIYGIAFVYPKILPNTDKFTRKEGFIGNIPVIEITSVSISAWERIGKRCIDILISSVLLILLFPLFILIAIIIKIEDPAWPVVFANRRIGQWGNVFSLFKFRYMYWKYCVKDAYGIDKENDEALKFEENLKQENDTRDGPLYKIKNDPRKTRFGKILEKFSIDELPQLYNVLIGNMSLVGPRPHQPREVELYDEDDYQVLTIKPGITGMAQVYGREKNTFDEEIRLDRYYIENYSFFLDIAILMRTAGVILTRAWKK
jgi:lipopolysaccharide/colanic/teichoic acid biosynthesis glycosyltransferase